jgi:hypothetical protein
MALVRQKPGARAKGLLRLPVVFERSFIGEAGVTERAATFSGPSRMQ